MIITANKALKIVASHDVIRVGGVVELLDAVELYAQYRRDWIPKKTCGGCNEVAFFAPVETKALEAIGALGPDAVAKLKKYLGCKDLWINPSTPGKSSELKKLI